MAAAASEQELGDEEEITPAITAPEQQRVEERDAMTHLDYSEKGLAKLMELVLKDETQPDSENVAAAKIMELLRKAQALREKISQLLGPADSHRVVTTGDVRRRWLDFMETELRFIAALLATTLKLNPQLFASDMWEYVNHSFWDVQHNLQEMGELAPHARQRAAHCFRRRNLKEYSYSYRMIQQLYGISQYTCTWYMHLLVTKPQVTKPQLDRTGELSSVLKDFPDDQLKLLSLYMSMLPYYGSKFEKDRLILKWIHEGFIHRSPGELNDAKSEAERFFSLLVDRKVITCVASNCKHKKDEAEACQWRVYDFMQEQLKNILDSKSAEMGFIFATCPRRGMYNSSATDCGNEPSSSRMPRRLVLHHPDPQLPSLLQTMELSQTRSLSVSGSVNSAIIPLDKFVNLVVLDLEGWKNLKDEDLVQVCRGKMIFLRYLSVRNTPVSKLPDEIKVLLFLLTLDVSCTQITELPLEVFELRYLEHLDTRRTKISQLPKQIVGLQGALQDLLIDGGEGTINSVETAARVPHDVQHLYKLQTLATFDLTEHPASFVRALGDLHRLKVLAFTWSFHQSIDRDYCDALLSSIAKWKNLKSLTIHCGLGCSMEFLASLEESGAPRGLKKFKVTAGRFASVPRWINALPCWCLAFVQITVCNKQTTTHDLYILGHLSELQCLILGLDFIPSQAMVIGNEGFCRLKRFSIECPMPWLIFQAGSMPRLTHLKLKFSSGPASEERVPSGISNLSRIREVVLSYSKWYSNSKSVEMTLKAVREQVANHDNRELIHLFINDEEVDVVQAVDEEATGTPSGTDDAQAVDDEEATGVAQTENTEAEGWQASLAYCALLFAAAYMYLLWSDGVSVWWSVVNAALLSIYMLCS